MGISVSELFTFVTQFEEIPFAKGTYLIVLLTIAGAFAYNNNNYFNLAVPPFPLPKKETPHPPDLADKEELPHPDHIFFFSLY